MTIGEQHAICTLNEVYTEVSEQIHQDNMKTIISKYYLNKDSKLVLSGKSNGKEIDCWFEDTNNFVQHRCISMSDYNTIK